MAMRRADSVIGNGSLLTAAEDVAAVSFVAPAEGSGPPLGGLLPYGVCPAFHPRHSSVPRPCTCKEPQALSLARARLLFIRLSQESPHKHVHTGIYG
jgi:hypothetical protein